MPMTDRTTFDVGLDDETMERLMDLAVETKRPPKKLLEAIVRDVLMDDALAHDDELRVPAGATIN